MTTESRPYSIVILGATGVTGRNCCEYFAENYGTSNIPWAIAGRNKSKLQKELVELLKLYPNIERKPDILIADSSDDESLENLVKQMRVIISTVGPFMQHGEPLVRACVKHNTHYIDSTGETPFVKLIADTYHREAKENNVLIIPSCGYDCVPSDMAAFLLAHHFKTTLSEETKSVHLAFEGGSGAISGGTIASAAGIVSRPAKEMKQMMNPSCIIDEGIEPTQKIGSTYLSYNSTLKKYQAFYFMEFPNIRHVLRSQSLLKNAYGPDFQYSEGMSYKSIFAAILSNAAMMLVAFSVLFPPTRWLVQKLKPPGDGPTREEVKKGFFKFRAVGTSSSDRKAIATIVGVSDPGYGETCKMLVESALCIALEKDRLPREVSNEMYESVAGGVVTPAAALGLVLVERLRKAKMTFDVRDI